MVKKVKQFDLINDKESVTGDRSEAEEIDSAVLVEKINRIPLIKNTMFGMRTRVLGIDGRKPASITVRYEYPRISPPDGISSTFYEYEITIHKEDGLVGGGMLYILSKDYEMVAGEWRFMLLNKGRLLMEKKFILSN